MDAVYESKATTESSRLRADVRVLQELFHVEFEIWEKSRSGDWETSIADKHSQYSCSEEELEASRHSQEPVVKRLNPERVLLRVPLPQYPLKGINEIAVAEVLSYDADLTQRTASLAIHHARQEMQLKRVTQENETFLQQVSEDFEELAFLRSMAQRLVLDSFSHDLADVIDHSLPLIGDAIGVEHIYYISQDEQQKIQVSSEYDLDPFEYEPISCKVIERLASLFIEKASLEPVVRNHIQLSELATALPGIREMILVPLARCSECHGWFVAVNRKPRVTQDSYQSICKLSQNELGTNEASLLNTAAAMIASHAHNLSLLEEREDLLVNTVKALVSAIDSRDPYTCGHSERVAQFGRLLAEAMGFDESSCEKLYLTGLLHDLGKIGVSDAVLNKKGALTDEEFAEIQKHPDLGWSILRDLEQLNYVLPGVLHHHERFDGKGYPDGLTGDVTPLDGRLLAVVDAFDAMTSDRPYRKGMPVEKATAILREGAGTQWDRQIVEAFLGILPQILEAKENYQRPPLPSRVPGALKNATGALNSLALTP